jgi:hypothetical protein
MTQVFQKQPLELSDLASCKLEQNGNKLVLKTSSAFQQERLLKEENRRKLQDALRSGYPALELEITCDAREGKREAGKDGRASGSSEPVNANRNLNSPGSASARSQWADAGASRVRGPEPVPDPTDTAIRPVGAEPESDGEGQIDAAVGVALTLFKGKIIDQR